MRVDELRFGVDGKVAAVWVRRQLTHEEREALLQRPDDPDHVPDRFDVGKLRVSAAES